MTLLPKVAGVAYGAAVIISPTCSRDLDAFCGLANRRKDLNSIVNLLDTGNLGNNRLGNLL